MKREHWLVKNILSGAAFGVSTVATVAGIMIAWEHLEELKEKFHGLMAYAFDDDDEDYEHYDDSEPDFDQMTEPQNRNYHNLGSFPNSTKSDDAPLCTHGD